jgi:flavin-dependent dehydrogenase
MIGHTAGLIHPMCGNGMAMAIHSAKIASDLVIRYRSGKSNKRVVGKRKYSNKWNYNFKKRLKIGRLSRRILQRKLLAAVMRILIVFPSLLPIIIKKTPVKPYYSNQICF